jgi:hypothetical protein
MYTPVIFLPKLFAQAAIWFALSKVSRASMRIPSVRPEISVLLDGAQVATSPSPSRSGQLYGRIGAT